MILPITPANVSQEATGDPAKNMQGGRCGAICRRWYVIWRQEFLVGGVAPAPQLEVVRQPS